MPSIKKPACYDVSHWKEIQDFTLVSPKPLLFITKATEHVSFVDSKFVRFFAGMAQIGVRRGAFHFHRKTFKATDQAAHFCDTVRSQITVDDVLILDVEEGGETAAQLKVWFDYVHLQFPENQLMLYSRKNILDLIVMNYAEREYFKQIPTWTAGYPANPDALATVPTFYVPDQTKYGPCWLWQYSEKGQVTGIEGDVDLNWINPVFAAILDDGGTVPPDGGNVATKQIIKGKTSETTTVRSQPSGDVRIGSLPINTNIEGDAEGGTNNAWIHIYAPMVGWVNKSSVPNWGWVTITVPDPEVPGEPEVPNAADMPFTLTLGGGTSPYVAQTITGIVKAK